MFETKNMLNDSDRITAIFWTFVEKSLMKEYYKTSDKIGEAKIFEKSYGLGDKIYSGRNSNPFKDLNEVLKNFYKEMDKVLEFCNAENIQNRFVID